MDDEAHMQAALALARRGLGSTWPNPAVGCVLVRDGRVVGRGVTAAGGRPHAEAVALAMAAISLTKLIRVASIAFAACFESSALRVSIVSSGAPAEIIGA